MAAADGLQTILVYLFDFGDNWVFQINKTRHKDKVAHPGMVYPRVIEAKGKNPEQYQDWEYEEEQMTRAKVSLYARSEGSGFTICTTQCYSIFEAVPTTNE